MKKNWFAIMACVFCVMACVYGKADIYGPFKHGHRRGDKTGPVATDQPLYVLPNYATTPWKFYVDNNTGNVYASGSFTTATGTMSALTISAGSGTFSGGNVTISAGYASASAGFYTGASATAAIDSSGVGHFATGTVVDGGLTVKGKLDVYGEIDPTRLVLTGNATTDPVIDITQGGGGTLDIQGTGDTWSISKAGVISGATGTFTNMSAVTFSGTPTVQGLGIAGSEAKLILKETGSSLRATLGKKGASANSEFYLKNEAYAVGAMGAGVVGKIFGGAGGYGLSDDVAELNGHQWSMSIWFKITDLTRMCSWSSPHFFSFDATDTTPVANGLNGCIYNDKISIAYVSGGAQKTKPATWVQDTFAGNVWYHSVITHDTNDTLTGYINGDSLSVGSLAAYDYNGGASDTYLFNGNPGGGGISSFDSVNYNEIRVYKDHVLSATQAIELWANGAGTQDTTHPYDAYLVARWKLDTAGTTEDEDINGSGDYDLDVVGSAWTTDTESEYMSDTYVISAKDGSEIGDNSTIYFGDNGGNSYLRGKETVLSSGFFDTARITIAEFGAITVSASTTFATDSVKIGNTQSLSYLSAGNVGYYAIAGYVEIASTTTHASATFSNAFPDVITSVTITPEIDSVGATPVHYCGVVDVGLTGFGIVCDSATEADSTKIYYTAVGY